MDKTESYRIQVKEGRNGWYYFDHSPYCNSHDEVLERVEGIIENHPWLENRTMRVVKETNIIEPLEEFTVERKVIINKLV